MADALLDDLDDLSDVDPEEEQAFEDEAENNNGSGGDVDGANNATSTSHASDTAPMKQRRQRLLDDAPLKSHLSSVRAVVMKSTDDEKPSAINNGHGNDTTTKEEDEHQHVLILASNRHLVSLGHEIHRTHSDLSRQYNPKFPELEELLTDPFQYRAAIGILQNEMDVTKANEKLNDILTSNQIITISVAGSTTSGSPLTEEELKTVNQTCAYLDKLKFTQSELTTFVESRMERWAPSICALIGPSIAAQLLAATGGLAELSKIPACNLQLLGKNKSTSASRGGMATQTRTQHAGILVECDLVQGTPNYLKMKAVKAVAGKLALSARTDHVNVESGRRRTSDVGRTFYEQLRVKFGKWEEPDKAQVVKALPKPDLTTKKRRGGKRIRRMKERFEETEMMKQANRRAFSAESGEYGDDAMGITLGMLDTKEGGAMRNTVEKRKMKQANTKASRKRAVQMSSGATNGLASSMVFTPVQGLELVNPDANRDRVRQANAKWFSDNAGFQSALPKK